MNETPLHLTEDRLLSEKEVRALTNKSQTTRWRMRREGRFPPLIAGHNSLSQIQEWIAEERKKAEAEAKAEVEKSALPPKRGRQRKAPAAEEAHA